MPSPLQRLRHDERGMSFVFVGAGFFAFLAATTLAIDVGMFMTARSQSQTAADALLNKCPRIRRSQGHNRVQVRDVPALLQHVDVDDDLRRFIALLDAKELLDHGILFGARSARINLQDAAFVPPFKEAVG